MSRRKTKKARSVLAVLLSAAMVFSCGIMTIPTGLESVFAADTDAETYCGKTEHVHDKSCYEKVLVCGLEESEGTEGHTHTEECYETVTTLICGQEESEGHIHTDACYDVLPAVLICGMEESAGHTHDASCYDEEGNLICGQEESEGHAHTDACYSESQRILTCGQEESEGHVHTDACYETEKVLVCGLEEASPEEGHVHTKECYEKTLVCELEEHEHTLACYSNPNADVESAETWESTLPELTGVWRDDVVLVAQSQIGYTESTSNYEVVDEETGKIKGYTRYGAWYGAPYEDWCAMFASFCLHYAGIPTEVMPEEAEVNTWIADLTELGLYAGADHEPLPGDLIFFDNDGNGADHVGIVERVKEDTIVTIEGNSGNAVTEDTYAKDDPSIIGYGILPEQPGAESEAEAEPEEPAELETEAIAESESEEAAEEETETEEPLDEDILMLADYLDEYFVTDLTLREKYTAEGGQEYDAYSFTPEADGIYYADVSGEDVSTVYLYYYDAYNGYPEYDGYLYIKGGDYGTPFVYLNADELYYIVVENSGSYARYDINIDGIASGEQPITVDTEYDLSSSDVRKDAWEEAFFTFVPETIGDYTFTTSSGNSLSVMWENPYSAPDKYNYQPTGSNTDTLTMTLSAGTTYYLLVWPNSDPPLSGTLTVTLDKEYPMVELKFNETYEVTDPSPMYSDSNADVYVITPEVDGMYWIEADGDVGITIYYPYNSNRDPVGWDGRDIYNMEYISLNGGVTYYLVVWRYGNDGQTYDPDSFEGYSILWTGVRSGDNSITLDTETAVTKTRTYEWDGTAYQFQWEMYTFTPEVSGLYTFSSNADTAAYITDAYQINHYDIRPTYYLSGGAEGPITLYMAAGETYFMDVLVDGSEAVNVLLTMAGANMIQSFTHIGDKTSAGSEDTISYKMDTQVTVPQYIQLSTPVDMVAAREETPEDFTITFHDTLDKGLAFNEDSVVVTMNYDDGYDQDTLNLTELNGSGNADGNTLYTVITDCSDGCEFEVTIDLTELYWTYDDDGYSLLSGFEWVLPYITFEVAYDAVLNSDAEHNNGTAVPGEYDSTAYVSTFCTDNYYEPEWWYSAEFTDESDTVTVAVDTYGVAVVKFDNSTWIMEDATGPDYMPDGVKTLAGAEFTLATADGTYSETLVTDENGCAYSKATFADNTALILTETKAPDGYELSSAPIEFTLRGDQADTEYWYWETVGDSIATFDVMIYKYADGLDNGNDGGGGDMYSVLSRVGADSVKTYDVNYNNPLVGVEFTLSRETDDGTEYAIAYSESLGGSYFYYVITDWTTDKSQATTLLTDGAGYLEFGNLPAGTYTLTETVAPEGYYQLADSIVFTVDSTGWVTVESGPANTDENEYGNWITVANEAVTGKFELDKTDESGNVLSGAEFILGAYAEYNPQFFSFDAETYAVTDDEQYEYYYFRLDYDEKSESYVWNADYWYDTRDEATVMATGTDGTLNISGLMTTSMLGGTYFLIETEAPDGYKLLEDPIVFTVSDNGAIQIVVPNDQASMNADGTVMTVTDELTVYPVDIYKYDSLTKQPLDGVMFSIARYADDGSLEYARFSLDGTNSYVLTSWGSNPTAAGTALYTGEGEDGWIYVSGLPAGEYQLVETTPLPGYVPLDDSIAFTINNDGTITSDVWNDDAQALSVGNDLIQTSIYKTDEDGNPLSGAEFVLGAAWEETITQELSVHVDGTDWYYEYLGFDTGENEYILDVLLDSNTREGATSLVTNSDGMINIKGLPEGLYFLIETKAPDGYALLEDPILFIVGDDGTITLQTGDTHVSIKDTVITVQDDPKTFDVTIYKYDPDRYVESFLSVNVDADAYAVTNYGLEGAEFVLSKSVDGTTEYAVAGKSDDDDYYTYTITDWTTDVNEATALTSNWNGYVEIINLEADTYTLTETKAPYGYDLLTENIIFTVDSEGNISEVSGPAEIENGRVCVANTETKGSFELDKTDSDGNSLSGAEFILGYFGEMQISQISEMQPYLATEDGKYYYYYLGLVYDENSGSYALDWNSSGYNDMADATTIIVGEDGVEITDLFVSELYGSGGYFLIETKAPDGYDLIDGPIVFTVGLDGTIEIIVDNAYASVSNDGTVMTVVNYAGSELPETGGVGVLPFMMTGVIMAGGAAVALRRRRRYA